MIQVFITHACNGDQWVESWKDSGPGSVAATFSDAGITVVRRFRGIADPNVTGLMVEAENMEAFANFAKSSEDNPNFLKLGVDLDTLTYLGAID